MNRRQRQEAGVEYDFVIDRIVLKACRSVHAAPAPATCSCTLRPIY